ncbi:hypothetical protein LSTR_LSTR002265 [Laodelphax striatellus]|uniref:Out at first protein n=1 Tax=Laodelphax striatellus TaxID=195883 RepID=A0A482XFJ9_LAOST|nr:hypothetical protein LSTR_LSTR002265 [Laodelphax striatellus]
MFGKTDYRWLNLLTVAVLLLQFTDIGNTQLLINVKNQGGDVVQETISSNVSEDSVTLEFQRSDGTLITQLVDFTHEVQILKALVLGEEERGQSQYQVMCFVCHINKDEFISSDAMAKLRQKNPGTVRTAEEDRGRDNYQMDLFVDVPRSAVISRHVVSLCSEAKDATYTRRKDLDLWAAQPGGASLTALLAAVREYPVAPPPAGSSLATRDNSVDGPARCRETPSLWSDCTCHLEMCIGWYPCSLKYCKSQKAGESSASYRCGIRTCRKCSHFSYYVRQRQLCLWDE